MIRSLPYLPIVLAALCALAPCRALQAQPQAQLSDTPGSAADDSVLTVVVAPLDRVLQNVSYLTTAAGSPEMGGFIGVIAATYTEGLDRTRPVGLIVPVVEGVPSPLLMLPVQDLDVFLKRLEQQLGQPEELDDGTLVVTVGGNLLYLRETDGGWAVAAQQRPYLDNAPADPMQVLGGMSKEYDVAVRLNVAAIPVQLRDIMLAQLEQGFQQGLQSQESDAEGRQAAQQMGRQMVDQLKQLISQTESLQVGWVTVPSEGVMHVDVMTEAQSGTDLAQQINEQKPIPSRFGWVIQPDAAAYVHAASSFGEQTKKQAELQMDQVSQMISKGLEDAVEEGKLDSQARSQIDAIAKDFLDLVRQQIQLGKSDTGVLVRTDGNQLRIVGGGAIADGSKVADLLQRLAQLVQDQPNAPEFKFNEASYSGVNLHRVIADLPQDEEEARKIFGDSVTITVGTAAEAVYFAVGPGSEALLKQLIDSAGTAAPASGDALAQINISLAPIFEFAQWVKPNAGLDMALQSLRQTPGKDGIHIVSQPVENGQKVRLTVQEGLLRAAGAVAKASSRQQPQF